MTRRIIFWLGRTLEDLAPPLINTEGRGGSETAVVEIARRFAADGWRVDVFTSAGRHEGIYDGDVGYWEPGRLGQGERADVLVSWRHPEAHDLPVEARTRLLWLHDHSHGPRPPVEFLSWDRVLGVSAYHRDYLTDAYALPPEKVGYVPNGVDLARFDPKVKKVPGRCVYASSPDRDLITLLKMWPEIVGSETKPELHVCYGWQNIDRHIEAGRTDMAEFKAECTALLESTPQVVFRGRLPQDELARLYAESYAWLYPTSFLETSCISAMEAMAGGCVPVTSSAGALKDTVGDGGLVVYGPGKTRSNPYSPAWCDFYVACARAVLFEVNTRKTYERAARERAQVFSWDKSYADHWKPLVEGLLS